MNKTNLAYCNECEDLVEYDIQDEEIIDQYKGETVKFKFKIGRCKCCNSEVATDTDYNIRKSEAKIEAYKRAVGIISLEEIQEILIKYNFSSKELDKIAGFEDGTIEKFFEGYIPTKEKSNTLFELLKK